MRRRGRGTPTDDWTSEVSSGYALAGFLGLVFLGFTLLAMGPLIRIDAYFNLDPAPAGWRPVLYTLDRVGQRLVCLPILGVVVWVVCRRAGTWRPAVIAAVAVFMLNLVVLILKVGLGRGSPLVADPSFFTGGMAYPSGHSANIVLVYGLIPYLLRRYLRAGVPVVATLWGMVAFLALLMVVVSLTLDWHWFADLVAGLLVGSVVLQLTDTVNRTVPADPFPDGVVRGVRDLTGRLRHRA